MRRFFSFLLDLAVFGFFWEALTYPFLMFFIPDVTRWREEKRKRDEDRD